MEPFCAIPIWKIPTNATNFMLNLRIIALDQRVQSIPPQQVPTVIVGKDVQNVKAASRTPV